jgi:hypothetical protein
MPFLILGLTLAALIVWRLWARDRLQGELSTRLDPLANRLFRSRPCRWHPTGAATESLREFRCDSCGVTAYSMDARGPNECKSSLKGGL